MKMKRKVLGFFLSIVFVVFVGVVPVFAMQLFIKTPQGDTITIEAESDEWFCDIKEKLQDKVGLAADKQRLFYAGEELYDEYAPVDYDIQTDSTLYLFPSIGHNWSDTEIVSEDETIKSNVTAADGTMLQIADGVTLTVNGSVIVEGGSGTLTVEGKGTLVVNGKNGTKSYNEGNGGV